MTNEFTPDPDLEALVRELNDAARRVTEKPAAPRHASPEPAASSPTPATPPRSDWVLPEGSQRARRSLRQLLLGARGRAASDLLLVPGTPPTVRVNGLIEPLVRDPLSAEEAGLLCAALVPPERTAGLAASASVDFSFVGEGSIGTCRCNIHRARGGWSAAVRLLPGTPPDFQDLNLPPALARFAELEHGLVLVTGPTGSGKSTTLAAILKTLLARRRVHAITIEDPVEYVHEHGESVVEHVEIGRDAPSFAQALRAALRQDPDVLMVGEMRDRESISMAITAAETGHLVLSTLHTGDAPQTISRIVDTYPAAQMEVVRAQLAASLAGVVSQTLVPRSGSNGRVPAVEILLGTHAVRNLIRQGKLERLRSQMTLEKSAGMLSFEQSLLDLASRGLVTTAEARMRARDPREFDSLARGPDSKR